MKLHIILLTWVLVFHPIKVENQFTNSEDDSEFTMFERVPYPKVGSIPILNRKVFKGIRVTIREHPYIVSVRRKSSHYTMGALLSSNLVISVAHQLVGVPVHELKVIEGENYSDRGMTSNTVLLVIVHEQFDPYTLQADIALLRCHESLKIRGAVKYIPLIEPGTRIRGYLAHVTGWGRCDLTRWDLCLPRSSIYHPFETADPMLRSISFEMNPENEYCSVYKSRDLKIGSGMICAGLARSEDPMAPCMAVPGAPLVIRGRLVGLQSWGFGCGYRKDLPLIYTSMKYYAKWITGNVRKLTRITVAQLSQFYQATVAYEMIEWLKLTRNYNGTYDIEHLDLQTVEADMLLAAVNGTIYDIRDFVYNRKFNSSKKLQFKHLRSVYKRKLSEKLITPLKYNLVPFLDRNNTG